jgi:hypothetical protein
MTTRTSPFLFLHRLHFHSFLSSLWTESLRFCMWSCGRRCLSIPIVVLFQLPPDWSLSLNLIAAWSQPATVPSATVRTSLTSACSSTLWQCVHSSWQGRRGRSLAMLCFRPWRSSELKLYSCKRWIQRTDCPSTFFKLSILVNGVWSILKWNSFPYTYLWNCIQCPHHGK